MTMRRAALVVAVLAAVLMMPVPAHAWDKALAATYAETYAVARNPAWPYFSGADCTNFVSQALKAGGIRMDTSYTDRSTWYMVKNLQGAWIWGYPWTVAADFYTYFRKSPRTAPYRYYIGTYDWISGSSYPVPPNSNSALARGDIVSYDFDLSAADGLDHTGIVTAHGTDTHNSAYTGDLVCYHSTDTYRIIWHVRHRLSSAQQQNVRLYAWGLGSSLDR